MSFVIAATTVEINFYVVFVADSYRTLELHVSLQVVSHGKEWIRAVWADQFGYKT